jgi:aryl-alcohol dehydrogenase-like predicted oxidoreductase
MIKGISVALGTSTFGTAISRFDAFAVLDKFASLGGRVIDTANSYAFWSPGGIGGESEKIIGDWLEGQNRSDFTIMTKIGSFLTDQGRAEGLSPDAIRKAVLHSLDRLQVDYIDILLAHHDDTSTPLQDTWATFSELVTAGTVKHVGVSNYRPARMKELGELINNTSFAPIDFVQLKYSCIQPMDWPDSHELVLLDQKMRKMLGKYLSQPDVFAYSPLLNGLFDKNPHEAEAWPLEYDSPQNRAKVCEIQRTARELGITPSACVLREIVNQGLIPITMTSRADHLESNLEFLKL